MFTYRNRSALLVLVTLGVVVALASVGPIPQDPHYHHFADSAALGGIDNFWNVISNLPFVVAGIYGLLRYPRLMYGENGVAYRVICSGAALVGFGSAWYHLAPSNDSLLWDRLPMTVVFMALFYLLLEERLLSRRRPSLLWLLLAIGIGSVLYWSWSEAQGRGDLRPYVLVQFLPMLLIPLILLLFPPRYLQTRWLLVAFGFYLLAKLLEHFDAQIFALADPLSGHPLKHLAAALAAFCIIAAVPLRPAVR